LFEICQRAGNSGGHIMIVRPAVNITVCGITR
jgi:hypothetical protein